ncbi:MAG TPA: ABC transporter permease [Gaiellaceae bacterium]|jgi:peptide/nickel transport system permease protein|nr:ABC transporter permease [Gaiellaceae bacterium]
MLRRPSVSISAFVILVLVFGAVAAPLVAPYSPNQFDYTNLFGAPSWAHLFGTDELGRDMVTRLMYAGRTTLLIALLATVISMTLGGAWGFLAAFRGGWIDEILMRTADLTLAMPVLLLGLVFVAAFGTSTTSLILILGVLFAPATARLMRSATLSELESDYYIAAISVGAPTWRVMVEEVLPNTAPILLARGSIVAADAIFVEASLSFVGLGVQPPAATWGTLLQTGYQNLYRSNTYPLFPGIIIIVAVLALNTLGDAMQEALDPARR